ncbi:MAG: ammonium transporter [Synechococcaceae cyanobacterium SM2_3_1]|nr:ammonium transporter [Synechococcaceae cyanobacterium SM2_3_1]
MEQRTLLDTLWVILAAGMVFLMQPGFMCLESGLTRSKNNINVAAKNLADFAIAVALFWAFGFALMFGQTWAGWWGHSHFLVSPDQDFSLAAFFLFQAMFCGTATTIVSGAVAERMPFKAYLLISCVGSGLIYPVFGHWAWNGADVGVPLGWLGQLGFVDFAGSTVVHSIGGWISLAALVVIGPRRGRFSEEGNPRTLQSANMPMSVLGAMLLWFGWLGFNGGSSLVFNQWVPLILTNTILAGIAGMLSAVGISLLAKGQVEINSLINGGIAGLVAITASCHAVTPPLAVLIGLVGSCVTSWATRWLEQHQIDDAVGAVPVHLAAGIWGTVALALLGRADLLPLARGPQLLVQLLGVGVAGLWAFGTMYLLLRWIHPHFPLRVSADAEEKGLNLVEHGAKTEAYDLLQIMSQHAQTQDLQQRVPVNTFTEFGLIAQRYNQVMDALEAASHQIQQLNRKLQSENQRMRAELDLTAELQRMILPKDQELQKISDLEIAGWMQPADEVGGDYYDVLSEHGLVKIGIGDVTGHGLESGVLMLMAQTAVRTLTIANESDPVRFLNILNRVIYENLQRMGSDKNMSLLLLDYDGGTLRLSGQHEEMIVIRQQGGVERVDTDALGFPIGLEADIQDFVAQVAVKLNPGDIVVLYTDGITEAENASHDFFGLERLCEVVRQHAHLSARDICQQIVDTLYSFIQGHTIFDDLTLLVIKQV